MKFKEVKNILDKHNITDFSILNIEEIPDFEVKLPELPEELNYLKKAERKHPKLFYNQGRSIIIFMFQYWNNSLDYEKIIKNITDLHRYILNRYPKSKNILTIQKPNLKIARYSLVDEYHKKIKEELKKILSELKELDKSVDGKIFVDTSPIWEKILANISGLGFIGKNTLIISPRFGSYVFLAGLILNKSIEDKQKRDIIKNGCGTCNKCVETCPTKALSDKGLDFTKCISFWTTHTNKDIPNEIKEKTPYLFGCDICQEVCPYNNKITEGKTIFSVG